MKPKTLLIPATFFMFVCLILTTGSCSKKQIPQLADTDILHQNQDELTEVIIYDVFSPPVASRLYVYASLATYEAIRFSAEGAESITEKLHGFDPMPERCGRPGTVRPSSARTARCSTTPLFATAFRYMPSSARTESHSIDR